MHRLALGMCVIAVTACGGVAERGDAPGATVCEGGIGAEPVAIAEVAADDGFADVGLLDAGTHLVLVGNQTVARVDPCSGAITELARVDEIGGAVVQDDWVVFTSLDIMGYMHSVQRVPLAGGAVEHLFTVEGKVHLVSTPQGLMASQHDSGDEDELPQLRLHPVLEEGLGAPLLVMESDVGAWAYRVAGAGPDGVYIHQDWDAGGPLSLLVWRYGDDEPEVVAGTSGAGPLDAQSVPLVFARQQFQTAGGTPEVVRNVPGDPQVLYTAPEHQWFYRVRAEVDVVCWHLSSGEVSCLHDEAVRTLAVEPEDTSMVLLEGALYWLRRGDDSAQLVAAAL